MHAGAGRGVWRGTICSGYLRWMTEGRWRRGGVTARRGAPRAVPAQRTPTWPSLMPATGKNNCVTLMAERRQRPPAPTYGTLRRGAQSGAATAARRSHAARPPRRRLLPTPRSHERAAVHLEHLPRDERRPVAREVQDRARRVARGPDAPQRRGHFGELAHAVGAGDAQGDLLAVDADGLAALLRGAGEGGGAEALGRVRRASISACGAEAEGRGRDSARARRALGRVRRVSMRPKATALARMLSAPHSLATVLVRPITAALPAA